jgi:hypothetical protein
MQLIDTGLVISKRPGIVVPASIGRKMYSIYNLLARQGDEFGLYLRGSWEPARAGGPAVVVDPEAFYFPLQDVGPAHIVFLEEPPDPGWNVVIHRHPAGCRSFSGVDDGSINREFLASLLYLPPWEFPDAVINIPVAPGVKVQVKAEVAVEGDMLEEMGSLREPTKSRINPPKPPPEEAGAAAKVPVPGEVTATSPLPTYPYPSGPAPTRGLQDAVTIGGTAFGLPQNGGTCELVD